MPGEKANGPNSHLPPGSHELRGGGWGGQELQAPAQLKPPRAKASRAERAPGGSTARCIQPKSVTRDHALTGKQNFQPGFQPNLFQAFPYQVSSGPRSPGDGARPLAPALWHDGPAPTALNKSAHCFQVTVSGLLQPILQREEKSALKLPTQRGSKGWSELSVQEDRGQGARADISIKSPRIAQVDNRNMGHIAGSQRR